MAGRFVGVLLVEGVGDARPFNRRLLDAVHRLGRGDAADFKQRRHHVNHVAELVSNAADVLDVAGPGDTHPLPDAAQMRRDLLGPGIRRVERPRPAHGHVVVGAVGPPDIIEVLQLLFD